MSKVLILFFQHPIHNNPENIICYYESFANELVKYGNDVLMINLALYKKDYWALKLVNEKSIIDKVKKFNPDMIVTYNNQVFQKLFDITDCPVLIFDADSSYLFPCKDFIKKYHHRYYMLTHYKNWENCYEELGFSKNKICSIHLDTSIRNEQKEKTKNISFIGTKFTHFISDEVNDFIQDNQRNVYEALKEFWNTKNYDYRSILKKHCNNVSLSEIALHNLFDSRNYILSSILDLGLELYGESWTQYPDSNIALYSAFNPEPKFSLKHNQDLYNSSKICLSISHPQTKGYAFPWRVYDIMASGSMLISSYSELLDIQTKGFVNIPMYHSPYEARELCKKYLKEKSLREDITFASNEFIDKHGRWDDNFEKLTELTGVKLLNTITNQDETPAVELLMPNKKSTFFIDQQKKLNKKRRLILLFKFFISELPFANYFYSNKKKNKLYQKIGRLK